MGDPPVGAPSGQDGRRARQGGGGPDGSRDSAQMALHAGRERGWRPGPPHGSCAFDDQMQQLNGSYGHRLVLSMAGGLSTEQTLPGALQHGWTWHPDLGLTSGHLSRLGQRWTKWVWSERQRRDSRAWGYDRVEVIGAPFLYLDRLLEPAARSSELRHGQQGRTIVYPFHSHENGLVTTDHRRYIDEICEREMGREVVVCLHPVDIRNSKLRNAYGSAGLHVRCHGASRYDPMFLVRQLTTLRDCDRVVSNSLSTALLYGLALGCSAEVYGPRGALEGGGAITTSDLLTRLGGALTTEWALIELGSQHLLGQEELLAALRLDTPARRGAGAAVGRVTRAIRAVRGVQHV